jgi:hypothetical protein
MGNSVSGEDDEDALDPFDGVDTLGYRVLGVQPHSPAAAAGLVSFLDFLVGVENQMLLGSGEDLQPGEEYDDVDLPALLDASKGKELEFRKWLELKEKSGSARRSRTAFAFFYCYVESEEAQDPGFSTTER